MTPLLSYAEIFRRAMWSVFRVENEHLNNTLGYKRVDIVPLHFDRPAGATRDPSHKSNWKAVVTEVGLFITAVVLVYIVGFVTHS